MLEQNDHPTNSNITSDPSAMDPSTTTSQRERHKAEETLCWNCRYATGIPIGAPLRAFSGAVEIQSFKPEEYVSAEKQPTHPHDLHKNCPLRCPWVTEGEPVNGWEAKKTQLIDSARMLYDSYVIYKCPLYEADLTAQINLLDREDVAVYVDLPTFLVFPHLSIFREILFTMISRWNEYTLALINKEEGGRLSQAAEIADRQFERHYAHQLLQTKLPASPSRLPPKIRDMAIKELISWYEIDIKDGDKKNLRLRLEELKKMRERIAKIKRAARRLKEPESTPTPIVEEQKVE